MIGVLEVFKRIVQQRGRNAAQQAIKRMRRGEVIALDAETALSAAYLGLSPKLSLVDSVSPQRQAATERCSGFGRSTPRALKVSITWRRRSD